MASNSILHPRHRLPQIAPRINSDQGKFFIFVQELEARPNVICNELWRIRQFGKFAVDNHEKIREKRLVFLLIFYLFLLKRFY